jgi:hypothetical protein
MRLKEIDSQQTNEFFRAAAASFDPDAFAEALDAVPDVPAAKEDRVPHLSQGERKTYGRK